MPAHDYIHADHVLGAVDEDNDTYQQGQGTSKSRLDAINSSGNDYWYNYLNPDREPQPVTDALIEGTACHCAILEPDDFPHRYKQLPEGVTRAMKEGKAMVQECNDKGVILLGYEQYKRMLQIRDAVHRHPLAAKLLAQPGRPEQSLYARDPHTEALIKCRADKLLELQPIMLDLKSTDDAGGKAFARSMGNYRYHVQHAWYDHVFEQWTGSGLDAFVFIAFEKKPPYGVGVYILDDDSVMHGRNRAQENLRRLVEYHEKNYWPTHTEHEPVTLQIPRYAY